jgi:predicted RecA/RadA family phage recombinase
MVLIKVGEALTISPSDFKSPEVALSDPAVFARFEKIATDVRKVAPKADDFLYFTAVMMHAAEAALLDDQGNLKKDATGNSLSAHWQKDGESWKWVCSDPTVKPYKNANNDIFPEEELVKAHKEWVSRPLCLDHRSDSVDFIRGLIIDTYYDYPKKRVVALCALDKKNYPDLAQKVRTLTTTAVSMGTAVGRAICSDCGTVARAERDFCQHMRTKSCYGEINVDLKPIELSIVVNGADPNAHIRYVMAAAESISKYVDQKEAFISKISTHEMVDPDVISELASDLKSVLDRIEKLKDQADKVEDIEEKEEAGEYPQEDDSDASTIEYGADDGDANKEASLQEQTIKVAKVLHDLHSKVDQLQSTMDKMQKNSEETNMSNKKEAYFQGGGGVNEPTPGQPKYEKEDYQSTRDKEDKQMVGQPPFTGVGSVDGMHPGPASAGETEEARKRRLQRMAGAEERSLRRKAVVDRVKAAYFQGGGDVNEPAPGKPKYEKENYQTTRDKEDKQMTGQAPFPDVGAVDGLHPSPASADQKDELKRKQMLSRAKLRGRFVTAAHADGTDDKASSRWNVFANDKLILTATVDEITGGKADLLYNSVATKEFGTELLNLVRQNDVQKVASMLKNAQMAQMAPPAEPAPMAEPASEEDVDAGGTGSPEERAIELVAVLENTAADMREAIEALVEEPGSELAEFDELAEEMPRAAEVSRLGKYQVKVGKAVLVGMKKAVAELESNLEELQMSKHIHENKAKLPKEQAEYASQLTAEAVAAAEETLADSRKLMQAFVRYAKGAEAVEKKAADLKAALLKAAQWSPELMKHDPLNMALEPGKYEMLPMSEKDEKVQQKKQEREEAAAAQRRRMAPGSGKPAPEQPALKAPETWEELLEQRQQMAPTGEGLTGGITGHKPGPGANADDMGYAGDDLEADMNDLEMVLQDGTKITAEKQTSATKTADKSTKAGRASLREKLAQKAMQYSNMLNQAHPGGGETTQLDVKPTGDLAKVERLDEAQKKMLDVAQAPPKVRQAAAEIQQLVVEGAINPETDFPELIAAGLDSDAVKYWKSYYGEAKDGGSEFASELVKEHAAKKKAQEEQAVQVKVARCYELADDMVRRGMLADDRLAKKAQVEEMLKFDENAFNHFKNFVERQTVKKQASMPQVGQLMSGAEVTIPAPEARQTDMASELEAAFAASGFRPRIF